MAKEITGRQVRKNVLLSVTAQAISLMVSVIINLIVPKFISEQQYSYWQMYVLYVGYVGVLHFGLLDGLVLRNSQYDYDELNKKMMVSQFRMLLSIISFFAIVLVFISSTFFEEDYKYVAYLVSVGIITKNLVTYASYSLQMTNRINKYVILSIVQRVSFGIITVILLLSKIKDFKWYCLAEIIGDTIAVLIGIIFGKEIFFGQSDPLRESFSEFIKNLSSGFMLMIANWASTLLAGGAKMIIQWHWDDITFGKVSFAFSLTSLFLTFVNAISIVLFPTLKRLNAQQLPSLYIKIRNAISPIFFGIMISYFPGCWILGKWLPAYGPSLKYLGILLPMIVFSSKVSLLTNNYLKAYRKEKKMLMINVCSVITGFVLYMFFSFVRNNLQAVLVSVVVVIMFRSITSEIIVSKLIKHSLTIEFMIELMLSVVFAICSQFFSLWVGCAIYTAIIVIYLFFDRESIAVLKL